MAVSRFIPPSPSAAEGSRSGMPASKSIFARSQPRGRKPSIIEPANVVSRFIESPCRLSPAHAHQWARAGNAFYFAAILVQFHNGIAPQSRNQSAAIGQTLSACWSGEADRPNFAAVSIEFRDFVLVEQRHQNVAVG